MNSSVKSACLALSLCASPMACAWSSPFSSSSASSFSWPSWNFSKPAWLSNAQKSVVSTCDSAGESLYAAHDKVSQALDSQAAPSWNTGHVVQAGAVIAVAFGATVHCLNRYWQGCARRAIKSQQLELRIAQAGQMGRLKENIALGNQNAALEKQLLDEKNKNAWMKAFAEVQAENSTSLINLNGENTVLLKDRSTEIAELAAQFDTAKQECAAAEERERLAQQKLAEQTKRFKEAVQWGAGKLTEERATTAQLRQQLQAQKSADGSDSGAKQG